MRRSARCVITAVVGGLLVAGCAASRSSFAAEANRICARADRHIAAIPRPTAAARGISYALSYYTNVDLAVSNLRRLRLPSRDAAALRARWLDPAQRALAAFRPQLQRIRLASLAGDEATVDTWLRRLRHVGRTGVDGRYLASVGVVKCLPLFGES